MDCCLSKDLAGPEVRQLLVIVVWVQRDHRDDVVDLPDDTSEETWRGRDLDAGHSTCPENKFWHCSKSRLM